MRRIAVAGALVLAVALAPSPVHGDKIIVDRIETRPSILPGQIRVRALISATQTGGEVAEAALDAKTKTTSLKVKAAGTSPPFLLGAFEHAETELALVVAIPTTLDFENDFEPLKEALEAELFEPLTALGPRVRVQVIGYGGEVTGSKGLLRVADARKAFAELAIDSSSDEIPLVEIVGRSVKQAGAAVKRPKNKDALSRGVVILVSKGIPNVTDEVKTAITKAGIAADKATVRIHTIGYSPSPDGKYHAVRPLLALGELSRRSNGTFRWVKTEGGWRAAISQVRQEIAREHVITFFAPAGELEGKKLTVTMPLGTATLTSDPVTILAAKCGTDECDARSYCVKAECVARSIEHKGSLGTILLFGGIGVGALVLLVGVMTLVKRRSTNQPPAGAPHAPVPVPGGTYPGGTFPAGAYPGAMPGAFAAPPPVAAAVHAPPGGPVLIILTGPAAGQRLPVRHGLSAGKAPGNDLDLSHDGYASGSHAQIVFEGGAWMVYDRNSTNGTFSNGVRITHSRLDHGMTIRFGSTEVRFSVG
ncbi:MAG TPA: FHA domain-containing protein [Kofleriaceae bacterium]|nr:FHA domain-containing protein [Kofleriaceae bacterium]